MDDQWITRELLEKPHLSSDIPEVEHGMHYVFK